MRTLLPAVMSLLFLTVIAVTGDNRVGGYKQLIYRHAATMASATSTDCRNHGEVKYEFEVKGTRYVGDTYWLDTPCSQVKPGYHFLVNYDPFDPTLNTTMAPAEAYYHHRDHLLIRITLGVFVIGGLLSQFLRNRIRKRIGMESFGRKNQENGNVPN